MAENRRSRQIDEYVDRAQKGEKPAPKPAAPDKPIWERSGMSYEEYQRGMKQRTDESVREKARQAGNERQSQYPRN